MTKLSSSTASVRSHPALGGVGATAPARHRSVCVWADAAHRPGNPRNGPGAGHRYPRGDRVRAAGQGDRPGGGGGSGGGGAFGGSAGGTGNTPPTSPPQGNPGAPGPGSDISGGGGGAGGSGTVPNNPGPGSPIAIETATSVTYAKGGIGYGGPKSMTQPMGSGNGGDANDGVNAPTSYAGSGGSGIVVVRYQIAQLTATAKATGGAISYYGGKTIHTFTSSGTFTAPGTFNETVEYFVISGGGGGGELGGGGGAGGYKTGSTPITGPSATTITIGSGGAGAPPGAHVPAASDGNPSSFGSPISTTGGGGGGSHENVAKNGRPGGSGGGGSSGGSGSSGGNGTAGPPRQGYNGGGSPAAAPAYGAGGGGGAGGLGSDGSGSGGGNGGIGLQLPTTFQDPKSSVGAPGPLGSYWVGGGGGGGSQNSVAGTGGGPGGPYAGAGNAGSSISPGLGSSALQSTGSGGGGGGFSPDSPNYRGGGNGGSGIVLIAYPS